LAKFAGAKGERVFELPATAGAAGDSRAGRLVGALREATGFAFRTGALISLLRAISGAESPRVPAVPD